MSSTMWKVTVPADGDTHEFEFPGMASTMSAMPSLKRMKSTGDLQQVIDLVDVWIYVDDTSEPIKTRKRFLVVGTGHPFPERTEQEAWFPMATARVERAGLVWHVLESSDSSLTEEFRQVQDERFEREMKQRQQAWESELVADQAFNDSGEVTG
jgi:hypothetical protein